ncbi:hypothetical protein GCM10007973_27480 [Polymorphobacter multimanifer]|uniref:DUF1109 domain-containing protein n=1 Tax=Polymorphobacter multimanifer TaxID=1070431 RepID=A0A841LKH3_9SPHN|nr:DUF1109 domain-containing protein [Polymorphobacter multimanifer]MBB6229478.1 hypothetical protein [Polymorphobacter multimanifer]GGI89628.1 hypothetical protein GCM10007973_27480 [Polymorphobacter multimanifer]
MTRSQPKFLNNLVADLEPVLPLGNRRAVGALFVLAFAGFAAVALTLGIRDDVLSGSPDPVFLLRSGLLLMLGTISAKSALAMVRPVVGRNDRSWVGAVAMAAVVPAVALLNTALDPVAAARAVWWSSAILCLGVGLTAATAFATIMIWNLRRGAPVLPERAGWVTGIAAGSLGSLVYSLHCPANNITYIGLWYTLTIAIAAVIARVAVPPLIRW